MTVLVLSNGHGEDLIAGNLIDRLRARDPGLQLLAWPMVGRGEPLRRRRVTCVDAPGDFPSEGIGTLSARWMWRDLRGGWASIYRRQWAAARQLRGRAHLAVAVGDSVPVLAAAVARVPCVFVGSAKSARYGWRGRYHPWDRFLLRRQAVVTFVRDPETARALQAAGVPARFAGNPLMDDLEPREHWSGPAGHPLVVMLPGSRHDAYDNGLTLLSCAIEVATRCEPDRMPAFRLVPAATFSVAAFLGRLGECPKGAWTARSPRPAAADEETELVHDSGAAVVLAPGRFREVVHHATVVVGLAGSANEQAVGLGKPLVMFPTPGPFGRTYVRLKARYFGDAALTTSPRPADAAAAVVELLADPARRARMAAAGRGIMGKPGGCNAIVQTVCDISRGMLPC